MKLIIFLCPKRISVSPFLSFRRRYPSSPEQEWGLCLIRFWNKSCRPSRSWSGVSRRRGNSLILFANDGSSWSCRRGCPERGKAAPCILELLKQPSCAEHEQITVVLASPLRIGSNCIRWYELWDKTWEYHVNFKVNVQLYTIALCGLKRWEPFDLYRATVLVAFIAQPHTCVVSNPFLV